MNNKINQIYLSIAYLPPVEYFSIIANSQVANIEKFEKYQKQSFRSRCHIYSANGILPLIIPISRDNGHSVNIVDVKIDYTRDWQKQHWGAIFSAYKSSPFFDYYQDDIFPFFQKKIDSLFEFNYSLIKTILVLLDIENKLEETTTFEKYLGENDYRQLIHPKKQNLNFNKENGRYHQVFAHKHGFIENLSIIDLLFNEGPNANSYLKI